MAPPRSKRAKTETRPFRATRHSRATAEKAAKTAAVSGGLVGGVSSGTTLSAPEIAAVNELLRQFDMTYRYGPCVGITRTTRWERARRLGLDPPSEVIEALRNERYRATIADLELDLWHGEM